MRKKRINKSTVILILFSLLLVLISVQINSVLFITKYEINAGFSNPVRIVQLTDLHNHIFGKNNSTLISEITDQKPDIIVMTGDMLNDNGKDIRVIISLISKLSDSFPVYFSMGNHEIKYQKNYDIDLKLELEKAGAIVLDCEYEDVVLNGNLIRIGGYYGYYRTPHLDTEETHKQTELLEFSNCFENTDRFKLLLCHIPTPWVDWNRIDDFSIDLVLCGHYHGGHIRIPFIGGIYAPYVGWFPKYTKGLFIGKVAKCILSTGLGSESFIPRINNPPEIVIIDLK